MVYLGPLNPLSDADIVAASLVDALTDWDMVACVEGCPRPWRRRRWQAPRVWTCPGCRTRWTAEGRTWVEVLSPSQVRRLEVELGLTTGQDF